MDHTQSMMKLLKQNARTFYIPISKLPKGAQEAAASIYLCMRGLDEVEDHIGLDAPTKLAILNGISFKLQCFSSETTPEKLQFDWHNAEDVLKEVTLRLSESVFFCPQGFRGRVVEYAITMADRMALWVQREWKVHSEQHLNIYTYAISSIITLVSADMVQWFEGSSGDRTLIIDYGRGVQGVNMIVGRKGDLQRGVDFYPPGWGDAEMVAWTMKYLEKGREYLKTLKPGSAASILAGIPYKLCNETMKAMARGHKLARPEVVQITSDAPDMTYLLTQ